jgi:RND superfamily putative drug exporter
MLIRLARFSVRRRRLMIGFWLLLVIALGAISNSVGPNFATQFELPKSESNDVRELLTANSPDLAGFSGQIVFTSPNGVTTDEIKSSMTELFTQVAQIPGVAVSSPFDTPGKINPAGTTAFAAIDVTLRSQNELISLGSEIQEIGKKFSLDGVQIEYGGEIFAVFELPASELYGLLAAIIILVLAFGSVLAMGLPIGTALIGLGAGTSLVTIFSHVVGMPDFTTSLVAMIGLGVGIDYALFIVTRYREGLENGLSVEDAVVDAVDTSGRAVIFAGITVIISLLGLFLMGLAFARGLAIGAVVGVLLMIIASITLLPALLAVVKHRVNVTTRAALVALVNSSNQSLDNDFLGGSCRHCWRHTHQLGDQAVAHSNQTSLEKSQGTHILVSLESFHSASSLVCCAQCNRNSARFGSPACIYSPRLWR